MVRPPNFHGTDRRPREAAIGRVEAQELLQRVGDQGWDRPEVGLLKVGMAGKVDGDGADHHRRGDDPDHQYLPNTAEDQVLRQWFAVVAGFQKGGDRIGSGVQRVGFCTLNSISSRAMA